MSTLELADWIGKLIMTQTIEETFRTDEKDDSKPSQVGDESFFAIAEASDEANN